MYPIQPQANVTYHVCLHSLIIVESSSLVSRRTCCCWAGEPGTKQVPAARPATPPANAMRSRPIADQTGPHWVNGPPGRCPVCQMASPPLMESGMELIQIVCQVDSGRRRSITPPGNQLRGDTGKVKNSPLWKE
ncbi:unnamed protein product [Pleuronectes platessa]|uniref:Uncharacterized protein n=1 Tax=Pleuronectes platessa TaxID=8262 RepID=A0A9N7V3H2_PLEPL|nr:unnamed protein product [Pleuronectes platessa]